MKFVFLPVGSRSLLYGVHCVILHPWFVAAAWWRLYGFPWDPRLWVAFLIHDWGYWGQPNMDGAEGERHPEWAARVMHRLFDGHANHEWGREWMCNHCGTPLTESPGPCTKRSTRWHDLCLYHSRFYALRWCVLPSQLCYADKLAIALTPAWLYIPLATLSGEIVEYMALSKTKYIDSHTRVESRRVWFADLQSFIFSWVKEHKGESL